MPRDLRPLVHLRPPSMWVNDPNGPVHYRGLDHLYCQHNPNAATHGSIHWAHFTSPDLVRWRRLPEALVPSPGAADGDGCWSGCAVVVDDGVQLLYSGHHVSRGLQNVCRATTRDGVRWHLDPATPVIPHPPAHPALAVFRDPFVWRGHDGWRCVVGGGRAAPDGGYLEGGGTLLLYASDDLVRWQYRGVLLDASDLPEHDRPKGVAWECPQLLVDAYGRVLLVVSVWYPDRLDHVAWVSGRLEGDRVQAERCGRLDDGPDFYAPALTTDAAGRWLMWGWSPEARPATQSEADGWAGLLTAPRVVRLDDAGAPVQSLVPALTALRTGPGTVARVDGTSLAVLDEDAGDVLDIEVQVDPPPNGWVSLLVLRCPDGAECTEVRVHHDGTVELDRTAASLDDSVTGGAALSPPRSHPRVGLRVLVDRSVVELLTDDGRALTARVYPTRTDARGLAVSGGGGRWSARVAWWSLTTPVLTD